MNTNAFRIFCDVARSQSFSRGAEANGVSQSAATQAVDRLEKQLGASLIDRTKRPLALTREGRICYEGFREILELCDSLVARVQAVREREASAIRVAAIYSVGLHDMSKCMREFMKERPKSKIRLELLHPAKVYQATADAEVDVGLVSYPTESAEIGVIPLRSEEMVVVVPPNGPFAGRERLTFEELQGADFVAFDRDLPIRREADKRFRQSGVRVNIVTELDNIETIKQAIEAGLGASILPRPTVADDVKDGRLIAIPLDPPDFFRPIGAIYRRRKSFSPALKRFIELLGGALVAPSEEAPSRDDVSISISNGSK